MKPKHYIQTIAGLVVLALAGGAAPAGGQSWVATSSMSVERVGHTATLLTDGRVLVAGGQASQAAWIPTSTAELYDPATGTWTPTGSLGVGRAYHTATLLADGKVLVAGGSPPAGPVSQTAELYDPATGTWTLIGSMTYARMDHSATRLSDGKVLVAGGWIPEGLTPTAELYDPATGTWTLTGSMNYARRAPPAAVLADGKVLVAGAGGSSWDAAELYDPAIGTWTMTGSMNFGRIGHRAILLTDGTVLVAGGTNPPWSCADPPFCVAPVPTATAEIYDPAKETWRLTGAMTDARIDHTATLLANGRVLVTGGAVGCSVGGTVPIDWFTPQMNSAEEYDPVTGTWLAPTRLQTGRYAHTATLLTDGNVLVAGGVHATITTISITEDGELFRQCNQILTTGAAGIYALVIPPIDTEWPDTSIVSALDGNGAAVPSGGTTLSNTTTFTFIGTDNRAVAAIECRLDSAGFTPCGSPLTYSGLTLGRHEFEARAVDTSGNRDSTPALHIWTVEALSATTTLSSLILDPTSVLAGTFSIGTMTLTRPAEAGGAVVLLDSSDRAAATVPSSVTVAAGATSATFSVSTSLVPAGTSVTISATYGGVTKSAALTVIPVTTLSAVTLNLASVQGGSPSIGTVTLSAAAPAGGAVIGLASSDAAVAAIPASVTVAAGVTSATFTISTTPVAASTAVTISGTYGGVARSAVLTVTPPTLSSVSLNPTGVSGGASSIGTVTLSGPAPAGGAGIALSSSDAAIAVVPPGVTVPAGATSTIFTVSTSACASGTVTITAASGGASRSAALTVTTTPDTVAIQIADYFRKRQLLRVEATSTTSTAALSLYETSSGAFIGTLTRYNGSRYRGEFTWPLNPRNITVRSTLCGWAATDVALK
jgi:galactose oxidase-like protein/Kelch motif protein